MAAAKTALPNIDLLGQVYGTMGADSLSPSAQAPIFYDVFNKTAADALIEPLKKDERALALEQADFNAHASKPEC